MAASAAGTRDPGAGREIACVRCGKPFTFAAANEAYFEKKGFPPPTRCDACRKVDRAERAAQPVAAPGHKGGAGSAAIKKKSKGAR
jgi:hypothetical protein